MAEESKSTGKRRRRKRSRRSRGPRNQANVKQSQAGSDDAPEMRGGRRRQKGSRPRGRVYDSSAEVAILHHGKKDLKVSALNPDIFIYTYTLRPRALLDSYQAGPSVAEKMAYENGSAEPEILV